MTSLMSKLDYLIGWDGQTISANLIALDTETHAKDNNQPTQTPKLVLMSVFVLNKQYPNGKGWVVPSNQVEGWLEAHQDKTWVFHNAAFDLNVLADHIKSNHLRQKIWQKIEDYQVRDSMILKSLLDIATQGFAAKNGFQSLEDVIDDLGLSKVAQLDKVNDAKYRKNYASIDGDDLNEIQNEDSNWLDYPVRDARACLLAYRSTLKAIKKSGFFDQEKAKKWGVLTEKLKVMAAVALDQVHRQGVAIDLAYKDKAKNDLETEVLTLNQELGNLLPRSGDQPYSYLKKDNQGQYLKTEKGGFQLKKNDFFQWMDLKMKSNTQINDYQASLTEKGNLKTSTKAWTKFRFFDPALDCVISLDEKITSLGFLNNQHNQKPRAHPKYSFLIQTGRTSSSGPNIQGVPRDDLVRNLYQASEGHLLIAYDYSQLELAALAQICLGKFRFSKLAEVINQKIDPHKHTAREMIRCSIEDFEQQEDKDELRQKAKAVNFGIPGGMGPSALSEYAANQYNVQISVAEAKEWLDTYCSDIYPEVGLFRKEADLARDFSQNLGLTNIPSPQDVWLFKKAIPRDNYVPTLEEWQVEKLDDFLSCCQQSCTKREVIPFLHKGVSGKDADEHLFSETIETLTGRVKAKARYTQARNAQFQGLAADGANIALFELFKQGVKVVAFIHDEIIIEVPEGSDYREHMKNLENTMVESMKQVIPDVAIRVRCNGVMKHWSKEKELQYVNDDPENGQIIPSY